MKREIKLSKRTIRKWYGSIKMDTILIDKLFTDYYTLFVFANFVR